ncbi:MAG: helix-turn-helix transcriptional regulator [Actinomycetota bacterium]|nr:helix-turn-helix transcriptional regulator [Actinomycetota bacterium]
MPGPGSGQEDAGSGPEDAPNRSRSPRREVLEAAGFLAANAERPVRLADVAEHVSYSPWHLAHLFERELGLSPGRYLASWRLQRAKQLLLSADDKVVDICHQVGFESLGSFTSRFGADVGVSPTSFRRLPHLLAESPPRPVRAPGSGPPGSVVAGTVGISPAALQALGGAVALYVGLFEHRVARGAPVSGALLAEPGNFCLGGVPAGWWWLLGSALPASAGPGPQLLPGLAVVGAAGPLEVGRGGPVGNVDLRLDFCPSWTPPVVVALPSLALRAASARASGAVSGSARSEKRATRTAPTLRP